MGQLLSALRGSEADFVLDLDPPAPTEDPEEVQIYEALAAWLKEAGENLVKIRAYERNGDLLSMAMSAPQDAAIQEKAFTSLLPNIHTIKGFYDHAQHMAHTMPKLLTFLSTRDLSQHGALTKQLADVLDFVLQFDYEKMIKTALQNDFSYYRRHLSKMAHLPGVTVQEAEANLISLFMAKNLPFIITLETLAKSSQLPSPSPTSEKTADPLLPLAVLANLMANWASHRDTAEDTRRYCLRVMTCALVVFDRASPLGVFALGRHGPIHTRRCLKVLHKAQGGPASSLASQLQSSIKFWTMHYKDPATPAYVSAYLGD